MFVALVVTTASAGASIAASGTSLTDTSFGPSSTTARMVWLLPWRH
jgi:hypothetical protein